ncbi:hypothetical protein IWW35_006437, partial [Coemansia sp. RSA 1878]
GGPPPLPPIGMAPHSEIPPPPPVPMPLPIEECEDIVPPPLPVLTGGVSNVANNFVVAYTNTAAGNVPAICMPFPGAMGPAFAPSAPPLPVYNQILPPM